MFQLSRNNISIAHNHNISECDVNPILPSIYLNSGKVFKFSLPYTIAILYFYISRGYKNKIGQNHPVLHIEYYGNIDETKRVSTWKIVMKGKFIE